MVEELDVGEAKAERAPEVAPSFSSPVPPRYEGSQLSSLAFGASSLAVLRFSSSLRWLENRCQELVLV